MHYSQTLRRVHDEIFMQHLILTKLAVNRPSEEWLRLRIELFDRFCAPSIARQSNRNFQWLLAVHPETPRWFLERANVWLAKTNGILVQTPPKPNLYPAWRNLIAPYAAPGALLTSRLDSDDAYHPDYVQLIQDAARSCFHETVLDFPRGYQLRISDQQCRELRMSKVTHFFSFLEYGRRTAYGCGNHSQIHLSALPIRRIDLAPMWVEVCHEQNLRNRFVEKPRVFPWSQIEQVFLRQACTTAQIKTS